MRQEFTIYLIIYLGKNMDFKKEDVQEATTTYINCLNLVKMEDTDRKYLVSMLITYQETLLNIVLKSISDEPK